ncbi:MAG: hypothetical protein ACI4UE_00055 [Candidatus Scatovivens sp.]
METVNIKRQNECKEKMLKYFGKGSMKVFSSLSEEEKSKIISQTFARFAVKRAWAKSDKFFAKIDSKEPRVVSIISKAEYYIMKDGKIKNTREFSKEEREKLEKLEKVKVIADVDFSITSDDDQLNIELLGIRGFNNTKVSNLERELESKKRRLSNETQSRNRNASKKIKNTRERELEEKTFELEMEFASRIREVEKEEVFIIKTDETISEYAEMVSEELKLLKTAISDMSMEDFLMSLFDTLSANYVSMVSGKEATCMYNIFLNARKHFPCFEKLSITEKMNVMQEALRTAQKEKDSRLTLHSYARVTFETLRKKGLDEYVIATYYINGRPKLYKKLKERYEDRLIFVTFEYKSGSQKMLQSFLVATLWSLLSEQIDDNNGKRVQTVE